MNDPNRDIGYHENGTGKESTEQQREMNVNHILLIGDTSRTFSSAAPQIVPTIPNYGNNLLELCRNDSMQRAMRILSQQESDHSLQNAIALASLQHTPISMAVSPTDYLQAQLLYNEMQRATTFPTFLNQMAEEQNIRQRIQQIHNTNLVRQTMWLQNQVSAQRFTALQENFVNLPQAMPSLHPGYEPPRGNLVSTFARESEIASSLPDRPPAQALPRLLSQPDDQFALSQFQSFLRQHIEVFEASPQEANGHVRGRNIPIYVNQVGIRCLHCKHLPFMLRPKGTVYFPANTMRIYQAAQNMSTAHTQSGLCPEMPEHVKERFKFMIANKSVSGRAGRAYWATSAEGMGLVNTPYGIRWSAAAALMPCLEGK